jgi:hypothetical protein
VSVWLIERAAVAPVLVGLDDLQWAGQATLLALRVLPRQLARYPVAWVLARSGMRPGNQADLLFQMLESDGATRLALAPLSDDAVSDVLTDAFAAPPDAELLRLAAGAGGNPSVLTELIRGLQDEEALGAGIVLADEAAFSFRHPLLGRAVGELIPRPARSALHGQFGEILLRRGEPAAGVAGHLLEAASTGDATQLAGLDKAAAELVSSGPQAAARLAVRALELTRPGDVGAVSRSVAAAEALTAAGRFSRAARIVEDGLAQPLPLVAEARLRCALSSILCASGQLERAQAQAEAALAQPGLPAGVRDVALMAQLQALAGGPETDAADRIVAGILAGPDQHSRQAVAAAPVTRAPIAWDAGQVSDGLELVHQAARRGGGVSADARHVQPLLASA